MANPEPKKESFNVPAPAATPKAPWNPFAPEELEKLGKRFTVVLGFVTLVSSAVTQKPELAAVAAALLAAWLIWIAVSKWLARRRPAAGALRVSKIEAGKYLRGLLPFGQGETLLGRDDEVGRVVTLLRHDDFRFGYLTGEAGVGKTSLLRAGIDGSRGIDGVDGHAIVYVKRTGPDPEASLLVAVADKFFEGDREAAEAAATSPDAAVPTNRLHALLGSVVRAKGLKRLVAIWDQFEEFFVAPATPETRERFLRDVGECMRDSRLRVAFLLSLREEYVARLQSFSPHVEQPLDSRYAVSIFNWDKPTARAVLDEAVARDGVPFAEALREAIVEDLTVDMRIRPVELQLVATRLRDGRIHDLAAYRGIGEARGAIAGYVKEAIAPIGSPESQRQAARRLLLALCHETKDVRLPGGLTLEELRDKVRGTTDAAAPATTFANDAALNEAIDAALAACARAYLVTLDADGRYSLAHDYIVPSIRDATAGLRSAQEEADRVLNGYLADQIRLPGVTMRLLDYRNVRRHASPNLRTKEPARRLLRRSERAFAAWAGGAALVVMAFLTILLPTGVKIRPVTEHVRSHWTLSSDRRVALMEVSNSTPYLWLTDQPWDKREEIEKLVSHTKYFSPKSNFFAGIGEDERLRIWSIDREADPIQKLIMEIPTSQEDPSRSVSHVAFSSDDARIFATSTSRTRILVGNLSGIEPMKTLVEFHPKLGASPDSGEVESRNSELDGFVPNVNVSYVACSPTGDWVALATGLDSPRPLYLIRANEKVVNPEPIMLDFLGPVAFSPDGNFVAAAGERGVMLSSLESGVASEPTVICNPRQDTGGFTPQRLELELMANGRGVLYRIGSGALVYGDGKGSFRSTSLASPRSDGAPYLEAVARSEDGTWAAGILDNLVEVLPLDDDGNARTIALTHLEPRGSVYCSPVLRFSPDGETIVVRANDGEVYSLRVSGDSKEATWISHSSADQFAITFSADSANVFLSSDKVLAWGRADAPLNDIPEVDRTIQHIVVTTGGDRLHVLETDRLTTLERWIYLWGVPIWPLHWPMLENVAEKKWPHIGS